MGEVVGVGVKADVTFGRAKIIGLALVLAAVGSRIYVHFLSANWIVDKVFAAVTLSFGRRGLSR